jgi:hypothetical protein
MIFLPASSANPETTTIDPNLAAPRINRGVALRNRNFYRIIYLKYPCVDKLSICT